MYQLGLGREVAVIETNWLMQLTVRITSGAEGLSTERFSLAPSATLTLPARAVVGPIQLWAQREGTNPPTFEIGSVGAVKVEEAALG